MKISISITGQLRDYKKTLPSIVNFCTAYNIDIFLLIDITEKEEEISDVISLSNPVDVKYVESLDNCGNMNMWYKIQKGYEQIKEYENINNFKYDFYIRCRYDVLIRSFNVDFNQLNKNTLYFGQKDYVKSIFSKYIQPLGGFLSDEFFLSGEKNMNIYCNAYDLISQSNNKCMEKHLPEKQFYNLTQFMYTDTQYLDIKYRWVCFSDIECLVYQGGKALKGIYNGPIKTAVISGLKYIVVIFIIVISYEMIRKYVNVKN
tara:strand:- start:343 stop:1122 length:780 start_codon:yes stop_codon:yes gene_type:complete